MIALIIPVQRWILERRRYTTITGSFRPGLIDLGRWNTVALGLITLLLVLLTVGPLIVLVLGSFMTRIGYFAWFTLSHWQFVLNDPVFIKALRTTCCSVPPLPSSALLFIFSDCLYSGAHALAGPWNPGFDRLVSGAIPGILAGLGLVWVYRHARAQLSLRDDLGADHRGHPSKNQGKRHEGVFVQVGADMGGSRARVWGSGWPELIFRSGYRCSCQV